MVTRKDDPRTRSTSPARQDHRQSLCGGYDDYRRRPSPPGGGGVVAHPRVGGLGGRAMVAGFCAFWLGGALAALSVTAGPIPPFQMVAMTFAVGASIGIVRALTRGVGWSGLVGWPPRVWLLGVGGLFGYHALYFAALQLAPPAEANLVNYLWPLLIVLLSAPLAGERLGWPHLLGALLGFAGVVLLAFGRGLSLTGAYALGYVLALGCAFTWSLYSVLSRRFGETPTDAIAAFCAASAVLSLGCHLVFERTVWPASTAAWLPPLVLGLGDGVAPRAGAWPGAGGRRILSVGPCRQARRHPRPGRPLLRHADPLDRAADRVRPRRGDRPAADCRRAGARRRHPRFTRAVVANRAALARNWRTRRPATPCSRPASKRRASARLARPGAAPRPEAARRRRSPCRAAHGAGSCRPRSATIPAARRHSDARSRRHW